jgi:hypothetical protein
MDGVSAVSSSVQAMNQVLQNMTDKQIDFQKKIVKVTNEMALASQPGVGQNIDVTA